MADIQLKASKERRRLPQVLIIVNSRRDCSQLEHKYASVLEGVNVRCFEFFEQARDLTSAFHIDFVVIIVDYETTDKKARRQISAVSIACPEAAIILMAPDGFDAHDARVKAVVPLCSTTPLVTEIKKSVPANASAAG